MKKFKVNNKIIFSVLAVVLLIAFIGIVQSKAINKSGSEKTTSSGAEKEKYTANFLDVFDTSTDITVYAASQEEAENQIAIIKEQLTYYNNLYDIYNNYDGYNNIKTVNDNAGIEPVEVDSEIIELLNFGKEMYELTDGKVNIAMGSVLSIWHEYREAGLENPDEATIPNTEELQNAAEHTEINNLIIDEDASTVYLADSEMSLDVGSIAKGYAVQQTMEYCKAQGMDNILFSVGGNIAGLGTRADGTNFKIAIQNPDLESSEPYIETVEISDGQCVVSSGDYQRFYEVDGKRYCHIINPDTLFPSETFAEVTVLTENSGKADALSTALFNMSLEDGMEFVNAMDGVEAMWVDHDGNKIYSDGFQDSVLEY